MRHVLGLILLAGCASISQGGCASTSQGGGDDDQPPAADAMLDGDGSIVYPPDSGPPDPRRGWIELGSVPGGSGVQSPRLVVTSGKPVLAYTVNGHVSVLRFDDDSTWVPIGVPLRQSADDNAVTYDPSLAVGADGLTVVWPEWSAGTMSTALRRLVGSDWVTPPGGGQLGSGPYSFVPHSTAAVAGDGAVWIAWAETSDINAPMRIFVVSLLGGTLTQHGQNVSATMTNSGALAPDLAIRGNKVFMTWTEDGVRLALGDGLGTWIPFGGSPIHVDGQPANYSSNGHIAVAADGQPVIGFTASDGSESVIVVQKWNGSAWVRWEDGIQASPGAAPGFSQTYPNLYDIAVVGNDLAYIAWGEADTTGKESIYVYRCAPTTGCTAVGRGRLEATAGSTRGYGPRLAIDGAGRPLVTWVDTTGGVDTVHVWRYHGDPDSQ